MNFIHIMPTALLPAFSKFSKGDLVLAHELLTNQQYRDYYNNTRPQVPYRILDNGAFEKGKPVDPEVMVELGKKCHATCLVLPDYPGESSELTIAAAQKYNKVYKDAGFMTMFVPQGTKGDPEDLLSCFKWAIESKSFNKIGVSILAAPYAYDLYDTRLHRSLARYTFLKQLSKRVDCRSASFHMLGLLDGPGEISLVADLYNRHENIKIDSWDSSSAVWHGLHGIKYDDTPLMLKNGKLEVPVDFNIKCTSLTVPVIDAILHNIQKINHLVKNDD